MKKNVGLTYVDEFSFPAEQGFTGSAGTSSVKGYMRGGHVKGRNTPNKSRKRAKGTTAAAMGGFMGPEREIAVDDVTVTVPRKHGGRVKKYGEGGYYGKPGDKYPKSKAHKKMPPKVKARGGSVHDKLKHEGAKMGYAYGGRVHTSNTSGEFDMKRAKQDPMDHGNQPARRGRNQAEIEAGGTKRLKPGLKKGGYAKKGVGALSAVAGAATAGRMAYKGAKGARTLLKKGKKTVDRTLGKGRSKKGFPKTVKARGGMAKYFEGGVVGKAGAAQ